MCFFKKDISHCKMLERYKINIERTNENYLKHIDGERCEMYTQREFCELVAETQDYLFYNYMSYGDGSGGYILRQNKTKKKEVAFFGESTSLICVYHDYLFQADSYNSSISVFAKNIHTGEILQFNWLKDDRVLCYFDNGCKLFYRERIDNIFAMDNQLILCVTRNESEVCIPDGILNNKYYNIIVTFVNGKFVPKTICPAIFFDNAIKISSEIRKIQNGKYASLSESDIVNVLVNISDAKDNLSEEEFEKVYQLFLKYSSKKEKLNMDLVSYLKHAENIINNFNSVAAYEKYSGGDAFESKQLITGLKESNIAIKVSGLVSGVKISIGDVFNNLRGTSAAIIAIISISCALKYYFERQAKNNPILADICNEYLCLISKECTNTDTQKMFIDNISILSQNFSNRVSLVKEEFKGFNETEICGFAAASLYCYLEKDNLDLEDDQLLDTYFNIFKTAFVNLIKSVQ